MQNDKRKMAGAFLSTTRRKAHSEYRGNSISIFKSEKFEDYFPPGELPELLINL